MADFKRLADVEIAKIVNDEDTVLIEQGGEIKRVSKSQVGGGSMEYDLVLQGYDTSTLYIMSGSCEAVLNKLKNKEHPKVFIYGCLDVDYSYVPSQFFRPPTDGTYEYITFPSISVPGAASISFGINNDTGTLNAYMSVAGGDYVWAEEYSE